MEQNLQAKLEAERSRTQIAGKRDKVKLSHLTEKFGEYKAEKKYHKKEIWKEEEVDEDGEVIADKSENRLPEGMDWQEIPKFVKVHGWEKNSPTLKTVMHFLSPSRRSPDAVILEGRRLITDAINAGFYPSLFVFSRIKCLKDIPFDLSRSHEMYQIPFTNIAAWSELKSPPGIMASVSQKLIEEGMANRPTSSPLSLTVLLDKVALPDNMGALLRVAAGVGARRVVTVRGCADPWSPKAVRAAMGAHFRIPIESDVPWDLISSRIPRHSQVILADLDRSDGQSEVDFSELSQKLADLADLCQEYKLQPAPDDDDAAAGEKDRDYSFYEDDIVSEYAKLPLISKPYDEFSAHINSEVVVVIGGEAEGISDRAKKYAHENGGERLFIPLENGIDSLNVASAASVILFEISRAVRAGLKSFSSPVSSASESSSDIH